MENIMEISPKNLIHHEIIGLEAEIIDSTNPAQSGIKGKVIDETKNTLRILSNNGNIKIVPKSHTHLLFTIPAGRRYIPEEQLKVKVDGNLLLSQPENRIQTKFKKSFRRRINL
jgi:ribonuclease P protein subunit POP4